MGGKFIENIEYFLTTGMNEGLAWLAPLQHLKDETLNFEVYIEDPDYKSMKDVAFNETETPKGVKHLVYVVNHIAYTKLINSNTIVSGAFSGCWMGKYYDGEKFNVCHIDTTNDSSSNLKLIFLKNDKLEKKCYFLPAKIITDIHNYKTIEQLCKYRGYDVKYNRDVFGIITSDNQFYSFIMGIHDKKYHVVAWAEWKICDKKQILRKCLTQFEELYQYMIDTDTVISLEI